MPRFELIAGLDIGATKICLAVARNEVHAKQIELLGCYTAVSGGVNGGRVVDLHSTTDAICKVLEQAQESTKLIVNTAFVNIAGTHISSENVRGRVNVLDKETEVSKKDLDTAYSDAKTSAIAYDREVLFAVAQDYLVDGRAGIQNPVGLSGSRLEADYYFITGATTIINNFIKAVNAAGVEVEELVLSNLASSFSSVSASEKDLGTVLIDIGGSVTEITIFTDGVIRYDKMLDCGAAELVNALSSELKISAETANIIVKNHCRLSSAVLPDPQEKILISQAAPIMTITLQQLQKITEPIIKNILNKINEEIKNTKYASQVASGVVLIGGPSKMDGLAELAEVIFNMPVKVGLPKGMFSGYINTADPACITAMGLIEYAWQKRASKGLGRQLSENLFKRTFEIARDFIYDYF